MDQYFSRLSNHVGRLYPGIMDFNDLEKAITDCWSTNNVISDIMGEEGGARNQNIFPSAQRFQQLFAVSTSTKQ